MQRYAEDLTQRREGAKGDENMAEIGVDEVVALGKLVGLEIEEPRARVVAGRLSGILAELDEIPDELIESVEPAVTFDVDKG